jgi:membrane protein implicated in regulation of membrane protease activity
VDEPETWRWVWLVAAVVFAVGEMASPGSFFLLPFAFGAAVAAVLAFADVSVALEWGAFAAISVSALLALRPVARRLDRSGPVEGIGSRRLIGRSGIVLEAIPGGPHEMGLVRVDREEWRAESVDSAAVAQGTTVRVADVQGTRLVVTPSATGALAPESQEGSS